MAAFPLKQARALVRAALAEDIGRGDITTNLLVPAKLQSRAVLLAKADGVIAGLPILALVFGKTVRIKLLTCDGQKIRRGQHLAELRGQARALLTGERTALNFIQRLSGIATLTQRFVAAVCDHRKSINHRRSQTAATIKILDTRKTTPTLRALEKYAVACGGGTNHRFGLYDQILIKDNHLALLRQSSSKLDYITTAICAARRKYPRVTLEIEVTTPAEAAEAAAAGADIIMLDNFSPAQIKKAVQLIVAAKPFRGGVRDKKQKPRKGFAATIEISGGVTLANVGKYAAAIRSALKTNPAALRAAISIGALTHSAPALDLSLEVNECSG